MRPKTSTQLRQLFAAMATGGYFGFVKIPYFNGGLFDTDNAIDLTSEDLAILARPPRSTGPASSLPSSALFSSAASTPPSVRSWARTTPRKKTSC